MIAIKDPLPSFTAESGEHRKRNEFARRIRAAVAATGAGSTELCALMGWPHGNRLRRISNGSKSTTLAGLLQIACATGFDIRHFFPAGPMPKVPDRRPCATRIPHDAAAALVSSSIAARMSALGAGRRDLLQALGWPDRARLDRYLSGRRVPDVYTIDEIACALGCRPWELLPSRDEIVARCGCDGCGEAPTDLKALQ